MYRTAKARARELVGTVEFEFRRKYLLTESDPRYLSMTREDMMTDIWAHRFADDPKSLEEVEDEDFDMDDVAAQIGYGAQVEDLPDDFEDLK